MFCPFNHSYTKKILHIHCQWFSLPVNVPSTQMYHQIILCFEVINASQSPKTKRCHSVCVFFSYAIKVSGVQCCLDLNIVQNHLLIHRFGMSKWLFSCFGGELIFPSHTFTIETLTVLSVLWYETWFRMHVVSRLSLIKFPPAAFLDVFPAAYPDCVSNVKRCQ